jgi:DNA-directed RNA polymerase subunit RPC12/RpoP
MMSMVRCPGCGREASDAPITGAICEKCGARIEAEGEPPMVRAVDDAEPPMVRPAGPRHVIVDDDEGDSHVPCPACGSRWVRSGPWPWYLGTVGALLCKAVVCEDCGHEFDLYKPRADLGKRKLRLALGINGVGLIGIVLVIGGLYLWIRLTMNR